MKKVINIGCILLLVLQCSCKRDLQPAPYIAYVRDAAHGLLKTTEIDGWKYAVQYRPSDYTILLESQGIYDPAKISQRKADLRNTAWFDIKISRTDGRVTPLRYGVSSLEEYNQRLGYYLDQAKNDIQLAYGKDTLHPISYVFENSFNLTPYETMVVGFQLPKEQGGPETMQLSYTDQVFKNGIIKNTFHTKDIDHTPNLKF